MPNIEKELFLTKHRFGEVQTRDRLKDRKTRTRRLIQESRSGNGNTTDNANNFRTVEELFMVSIQTNTMISME